MSADDRAAAEARLRGLQTVVNDLNKQRDKGLIDQGRYGQLMLNYQQQINALEAELGIAPTDLTASAPSGGINWGQSNTFRDVQMSNVVGGNMYGDSASPSTEDKTRILVVFANPQVEGMMQVALDEEEHAVKESIRWGKNRDNIILETLNAARVEDVRRYLLDKEYHIVHFSAHGERGGGLALKNKVGKVHKVPPQALAGLLAMYDSIECVLLNACYTKEQGALIAQEIRYVIAMDDFITDDAARVFAQGFYDAIAAGRDVPFAYTAGCNAIALEGFTDEERIPRLFVRE